MFQGMKNRAFVLVVFLLWASFLGQIFADRCPECVDPHNNACKLWAGGQAKFQWATGENIGSDITLTAGPCGEPGESGTAYVFAYMNNHRLQCDGDGDTNPCGGDMQASDAFAIIKVSGNQKAFKHIFPGGITFTGNREIPASPRSHWAYTTVDKAGCDYQLLVGYPQGMRVKLTAAVAQCQPEFDNSKFGINITFWQIRHNDPYDYSMLARAQGSITVKSNKRTNCDPISFKPDLRDGSATAWIEEIERDYSSGGDDEWMISYTGEDYGGGTCSPTEGWLGPYYLHQPGDLVPASQTFCRVKFPAYRKDVYETPGYAAMEGWSYSLANKTISLNLGNSGTVYYHCNRKSGNKYVLSSIEHCASGVTAGNGETEWRMVYDGSNRLQYIHNGTGVDPNNPQTGTEYYAFEWTDNDPDVNYFSRKDTQSNWGLQRQWELEFENVDGEERAVKFKSNCSGGCGGSGEFEHIQYDTTYTDVIAKRFNAAGDPILENTIDQLTYGQYEPAYWVWIANQGFEFPDVPTGYCQIAEVPGWDLDSGDPDDVLICDPNSSQALRLAGNVTLQQATADVIWPDTKYYLEAFVRSIPGAGQGTVTISLCSNELGTGSPLKQLTYTGSSGVWTQAAETWDSATYAGTNPDAEFIITITGNNVEVDDVWLSALAFVGNQTKPIITEQKVRDKTTGQMVTAATWEYDQDNFIVRERKYVDTSNYMATKYEYEDGTFTVLKKRIDCETLNDDPDDPTGEAYITMYEPDDTLQIYRTCYPNGQKADVEFYDGHGLLATSYVLDTVTDANTLVQEYEYVNLRWEEDPLWEVKKHTSPRGGVTEYTYTTDYLVQTQKNPAAPAGQQEIQYEYDEAKRVIKDKKKDTDGNWVQTWYDYDPNTGNLNWVVADWGGIHAKTWYMRNTLGQVIRQFNPDNVVTGKSYGLGGELVSDFVISASSDPNDPDAELTLISQTRYEYNADGQLEKVKRAKDPNEFTYDDPDDWIVTKYEYDHQGRKTKVIEDYDALDQRFNLTTTYDYDRQGRLTKTTYPTGKWVEIERDGRGLVRMETVGHDNLTEDQWQVTLFYYGDNGNLIEQDNSDGTVLVHVYNNFDQLEKTYKYNTSGPYTLRQYDSAGAVVLEQAIDPNGVILQDVRKEYDVLGNLCIERLLAEPNSPDNASDVITVYDYDVAGNLRKVVQKGVGSQDANSVPETADPVTAYSYDALGRKSSVTDPNGIISRYYYSDAGQLLTVIDPYIAEPNQVFITTNTFNAAGRLEKTINPAGHYTINTYNSLNKIIKQVVWDCNYTPDNPADDVPVRQIRYEYDNLGNVTRQAVMEDPTCAAAINTAVDKVVDSIYDTSTGLLDETRTYYGTGPATAVTSYHYDDIGRLWRTIDPEGNQTRTYFDPANNVQVAKEERLEHDPVESQNDYTVTVFYDYDLYGNLYRKTVDEDGDGVKDATDPSTYFYYDALDRLTKQVGPDSVATYQEYDSFGNVSLTIEDCDPVSETVLNKTTEYVYDRLNRQAQVIAYDPNDTTEHVASQITAYEYNKRGQVEKITYPDESFAEYSYSTRRKLNTEVHRDGTTIHYWYDLSGNLAIESDDEALEYGSPSFITEYEYNAAGDLVSTYREDDDVPTAESTFVYNGLGLPESESTALYDLDAKTTTYTYDGSGNVLTRTHNGETITYTHDGLGRIETIDRGEDRIVDYHYIGSGTKIIGYPEADSQWEGYYDSLGRIDRCRSIGPDSETLLDLMYTYDENSNRDSVKYNHLAVPLWDIYTYDSLQRLIQADYGSPTGLASLTDYTGDVRFAAGVASKWLASDEPFIELAQLQVRDVRQKQRQVHAALIKAGLDTVVKEHNNGEMPVVTLVEFGEEESESQSTYEMIRNDSGELIGIVITDSNGRITLFTLYPAVGGTLIISISYDASGNETSKIFSFYDGDGNLVERVDLLAIEPQTASSQATSTTSQPISLQESLLDGDGGMMMMSVPEGPASATEEFLYDHLGNRYQVAAKDGFTYTYTHDLNNQYTHIHGEYVWGLTEDAYPEYDDNGNLQTDKWGRQHYYDYRNRLIEIGSEVQYGYDALGRRVSKYDGENNLTTYFYYDTFGRVIAEYEKADGDDEAFARSFVYGNGIDEVLAMFLPAKSFDPNDVIELAAFCEDWLTSNATYDFDSSGVVDFNDFAVLADDSWSLPTAKETHFYYLKDALGSVVGIVGGRFQRVSDREFYLYDVYGKLADASVPSAAGNPYFFTGRRRDPESGLYYFRARTYDPETGRFVQTDPIGYVDSMNLYEYVVSNPTNWVDPYGLKSLYKDQWSWWDRFRFENGMIGGWFGLSHDQTRRMDNYWLQYQRAQMLNQHPNEAKEYCKAAKSIASGCAKKAVMGYCEYIVFVDENGYGAVREKIIGYVAEPYTNRILMCYEYNGQDIDQAIADACNWQMVGADLVGLTDMSYGVDYLQGKESIDTTTGRTFSGEEQIVRGFQGTSKFCGTVAACAEGVMSCGTAIAGARTAPSNEVSWNNGWRTADGKFASPQGPGLPGAAAESAVWDAVEAKPGWQVIRGRVSVRDASGQLRVYDGAAIPPGKNYAIGLEVKSGTSPYRGSQRAFDSVLNSSGGNSLQGLGNNSDLWIRRALETRK